MPLTGKANDAGGLTSIRVTLMPDDYLLLDRAAANRPKWFKGVDHIHVVYVCENRDGEVIYVGQSGNWWERRWWHARYTAWWGDVECIHLHKQDNDTSRRRLERSLIDKYQPMYNTQGTSWYGALVAQRIRASDARSAARRQ